jgi:archaellum component FlaF (FlaF/FlaG flagellin family)
MTSTTEAPAPTTTTPVVVNTQPRSNLLGLIALGLAIIGFIFAALLLTAGIAWILLFPALILGAVGLFLPDRRKGSALAAVVIAIVGLILSLVGFRLPIDMTQQQVLNNEGVNPFSAITSGLLGGGAGNPGGTGSTETGTGVAVEVESVDCHTPLASVTGFNITGEVCTVSLAITNNGSTTIEVDSSDVIATANGLQFAADAKLAEGDVLSASIDAGESTTGLVYVNIPEGSTGIDTLTVTVGDGDDALATVNLGD